MRESAGLLLLIALVGAGICLMPLLVGSRGAPVPLRWRLGARLSRVLAIEASRTALAQLDMGWLPLSVWLGGRLGIGVLAALISWLVFHLWVLASVAFFASYQMVGWVLERERRRKQLDRHRALLDAVRYGAAVMSRSGNAFQMLNALAGHGPSASRQLFATIVDRVQLSAGGLSLADAVEQVRRQLADPMFDDIAMALALHERRGSRLVPALEALAKDWDQTVSLQREAKALRAGVEASVLILTILPFTFFIALQMMAPALLLPFHSLLGELLFGASVIWMVLGYRVLQRMAAPPMEERVSFALES